MKIATYFEMDLDIYRGTSFLNGDIGSTPVDWSSVWSTGAIVRANPSGATLTHSGATSTSYFTWGAIPTMSNMSVLTKALFQSGATDLEVLARSGGTNTTRQGHGLRIEAGNVSFVRFSGSGSTVLQTIAAPATVNLTQAFWVRFDVFGSVGNVTLRAKIWNGDASDEPSIFDTSYVDTSGSAAASGKAGIGKRSSTGSTLVYSFRVKGLFETTKEVYRFAVPSSDLNLLETTAYPSIMSVTHNPSAITPGESLGKRAKLNITFKDHKASDNGEGFDQGTFWGKFRARKLFRRGSTCRLKIGEMGTDLNDFETYHFVLEQFNGPTAAGMFEVLAQDVIKLVDNDRAQAPEVSNGHLLSGIGGNATTCTLSPSGIGNLEYPTSGYAAIGGKEIIGFTRSGDTLTITRGEFGTTAQSHSADDRVQLCLFFDSDSPADIIYTLMVNYAGVPTSAITLTDWQTEVDTYLDRVYTRLICEPTGVNKLINELIEQAGLTIWTDESTGKIRLQVLRGVPIDAYTYTPDRYMAGISVTEQQAKRITQVWTYFGVRNPIDSLTEANNYRSTLATGDFEAESEDGVAVIRKIFATWIPTFAEQTAQRVNDLQLGRYVTPPRKFVFSIFRDSGVLKPEVGGAYRIQWYGNQDEFGNTPLNGAPIQVLRVASRSDCWDVEAEEMLFKQFDPADLSNRVLTISSNTNNVNLKTLHDAAFPELTSADVTAGVTLTCIIANDVVVGSDDVSDPAFTVGTGWPSGLQIDIINQGSILGHGGQGGGLTTGTGDGTGGDGGTALYTRFAVNLTNTGIIGGGGGGGGAVRGAFNPVDGGGGGAGRERGTPGSGALANGIDDATDTDGGTGWDDGSARRAGNGGDLGQTGETSIGAVGYTTKPGGSPGNSIDGVSYVTAIGGAGTRLGPQVN